jgi:amino acid transporter/nucleotide-binding universal stress UspA family protein
MIGVGAMIGAGIFVLTGIAAGTAGPALILSFALNGIITVFTAMVYAELGSAIPEAGGGYLWVKEGLPGPNAFQAGWMSWFAHAVAGSLYAMGFGAYFVLVLNDLKFSIFGLHGEILHKLVTVIIILIFVAINYKGVSETGMAGNIVTVSKVLILLVFIVSGIWAIVSHPAFFHKFQNFSPNGFPGILNAMGLTFIAFEGYEIIVQAGEEVKNPRKNIPKAVFLSLAIVVPIYILVAFAAIGAVTPETNIPTYLWLGKNAELGLVEAAKQFMPFGTLLLLIAGLLSTMSALNATTYSSTRVSFAMGRDRNLPKSFSAVNAKTRTPHKALMFSGTLIIIMAVIIPIKDVASAADIMFLLLFLQVNIAAITLRKKYGDRLKYGYLMPFFPIVPIIGIITKLFLALFMFNYSPIAWYFTIVWISLGTLIYYLYVKKRKKEDEVSTLLVHQEKRQVAFDTESYNVLVPVGNPKSLNTLIPIAINSAEKNNGSVLILQVVEIPEQLPLSEGVIYVEQNKEIASSALQMVQEAGLSGEILVRISHQPYDAIIQTAEERKSNLIIMGWRGSVSSRKNVIGKNIDKILQEVNCEVLVVQQNVTPPLHNVLVPIANPNQVKSIIKRIESFNTEGKLGIKFIHVFKSSAIEDEKKKVLDTFKKEISEYSKENSNDNLFITVDGIVSDNLTGTIVRMADKYDTLVIGSLHQNWFQKKFSNIKPTNIALRTKTPVILYNPKGTYVKFGLTQIANYVKGGYKEINIKSEKELEKEGMLAPRGEEATEDMHTRVNKTSLLLSGLIAIFSSALMYIGDGNSLTWIGVGGFFVGLFWFTIISVRGATVKE